MPASIWSLLSRSSGALLPAAPVCQATTLLKGRPQDHRVEFVFLVQQRVRGFSGRSETSVHGKTDTRTCPRAPLSRRSTVWEFLTKIWRKRSRRTSSLADRQAPFERARDPVQRTASQRGCGYDGARCCVLNANSCAHPIASHHLFRGAGAGAGPSAASMRRTASSHCR
jgi:hypothetical protein